MDSTEPSGTDDLKQIDRFPLIAKIGEGGFGVVYLAYDPRLGSAVTGRVAIKMLLNGRLEHQKRFIQEAQLMRQLGSGIVAVHEFGEYINPTTEAVVPYFVMEYCERGTLADRLKELGRGLTVDEGIGLVEAIASSARTLAIPRTGHPNGIVHRDIKPSNFLIRRVEQRDSRAVGDLLKADEELILADFSIAKSHEPDATALTLAGGTPGYGAPEQFYQRDTKGNALPPRSDVDPTVDVYAASVVVLSAMSNSHRIDSTRYSDADFNATGPLKEGLKRATSRDPNQRHPDFDQWRDSLVASHRRSVRIRRTVKAAVVTLALAAFVATIWSSVGTDFGQGSADPEGPTTSTNEPEDPTELANTATPLTTTTTTTTADAGDLPAPTDAPTSATPIAAGGQIVGLGGLCLDVPNQTFRDGQNLWMWGCNGTIAQDWTVADDRIMVMGRCLDIEGPDPTEGAALQIWECLDVPQHGWRNTAEGEIVSNWNGLCVAVASGDANSGAALEMEVCDGSDSQRWQVISGS